MNIPEYLQSLCQLCGLEPDQVSVQLTEEDDRVKVTLALPEEELSLFIGSKGETLESIETLVRMVFQEQYPDKKLIFDIGDYKAQREEKLQAKAIQMAEQVLETGRSYRFGYLNSYERFLIHSAIAADGRFEGLETISEDTQYGRVLVLRAKADAAEAATESEAEPEN